MANDFRQYDEHGFPVPPRYSPLVGADEPARRAVSMRSKRLVVLVLLFAVAVPLAFGPRIVDVGRSTLARWLSSRAERKQLNGDLRGALDDFGRAISWNPNSWELYFRRAELRLEGNDLEGSLDDWTKLIALVEGDDDIGDRNNRRIVRSGLLAAAHGQRSWVLVRLKRGREAVEAATRAVHLNPHPMHLNGRAYARALANLELQEGLDDVNKALELTPDNDSYLDTRGYLLYRLGRNEEGLKDMNRAIELADQPLLTQRFEQFGRRGPGARERKRFREGLAVMYQHRGLINQALGRETEAANDRRRVQELGFDPNDDLM